MRRQSTALEWEPTTTQQQAGVEESWESFCQPFEPSSSLAAALRPLLLLLQLPLTAYGLKSSASTDDLTGDRVRNLVKPNGRWHHPHLLSSYFIQAKERSGAVPLGPAR
jgi:hypothetical protein